MQDQSQPKQALLPVQEHPRTTQPAYPEGNCGELSALPSSPPGRARPHQQPAWSAPWRQETTMRPGRPSAEKALPPGALTPAPTHPAGEEPGSQDYGSPFLPHEFSYSSLLVISGSAASQGHLQPSIRMLVDRCLKVGEGPWPHLRADRTPLPAKAAKASRSAQTGCTVAGTEVLKAEGYGGTHSWVVPRTEQVGVKHLVLLTEVLQPG